MNPRLIILIVIAAGMAIYFAAIRGGPRVSAPLSGTTLSSEEEKVVNDAKILIGNRDLPGSEPPEKPNLSVQVEVDTSKGKNRLYITISESHGYYVEQFQVHLWYVKPGVTGPDDSPVNITQYFDRYLLANGTLRVCMEVVPAELRPVNGDLGRSENWQAEIAWHGRARAKNPDPLPPRTDIATNCD